MKRAGRSRNRLAEATRGPVCLLEAGVTRKNGASHNATSNLAPLGGRPGGLRPLGCSGLRIATAMRSSTLERLRPLDPSRRANAATGRSVTHVPGHECYPCARLHTPPRPTDRHDLIRLVQVYTLDDDLDPKHVGLEGHAEVFFDHREEARDLLSVAVGIDGRLLDEFAESRVRGAA